MFCRIGCRGSRSSRLTLTLVLITMAGVPVAHAEEQKLLASDGASGAEAGSSVDIDGDTAIVGAPLHAAEQGAAYVYARRTGSEAFSEEAVLTASDAWPGHQFANAVAVSGDTAFVGASRDNDAATGSGAVYVFVRADGRWTEHQKLSPSDATAHQSFGFAVDVSGDTAIVGALTDSGRGAAYVFERTKGTWRQTHKLSGSWGSYFGHAVAVDGNTALISATGEGMKGTAYVFARADGSWTRQGRLLPAGAAPLSVAFGRAVALSGDTAVVGASNDRTAGAGSGAVYVFGRTGSSWTQRARLGIEDGLTGDALGISVSVSGDRLVAGSIRSNVTRTRGGSAFLFKRRDGTWTEEGEIIASDAVHGDDFGMDVAVSGMTAIIGAPRVDDLGAESGAAYAVDVHERLVGEGVTPGARFGRSAAVHGATVLIGAPADNAWTGSAHVFVRDDGRWVQRQRLLPADLDPGGFFGSSVALEMDTAIVGAGLDGDVVPGSGSVYVYALAGGTWTVQQKLSADDAADGSGFGLAVALSGDSVLVGAPYHGEDPADAGAAYVYVRSGGAWTFEQQLLAHDADAGDGFGRAVAIHDDTALVGAWQRGSEDVNSGATYVFVRSGGVWTQQARLVAADAAAGDRFGASVALRGDTAVVGAERHDGDAGAVYVFSRHDGTWTQTQALRVSDDGAFGLGASLAMRGDTVLAGADSSDAGAGMAYVFTRGPGGWSAGSLLHGLAAGAGDLFGAAVALDGDLAVIGSWRDVIAGSMSGSAQVIRGHGLTGGFHIEPVALPAAYPGRWFDGRMETVGGTAPVRWTIVRGKLPITGGIDPDSGEIAGYWTSPGDYSFSVRAEDSNGRSETRDVILVVRPDQVPTIERLPFAAVDRPYEVAIRPCGPSSTAFGVSHGEPPPGLVFDALSQTILGTPTTIGAWEFILSCEKDEFGCALDVVPVADLSAESASETLPLDPDSVPRPICRALELVAGTRLSVNVRLPAKHAPMTVSVLDGRQRALDISRLFSIGKKSMRIRRLEVPETDRYFVVLSPLDALDGEAKLTLKVRAPRRARGTVELGGPHESVARFATLPGAQVKFMVRAAGRSRARPDVIEVVDADGRSLLAGAEARTKGRRATLSFLAPESGGNVTVRLAAQDGTAGPFKWVARIRQPKEYRFAAPDLPVEIDE